MMNPVRTATLAKHFALKLQLRGVTDLSDTSIRESLSDLRRQPAETIYPAIRSYAQELQAHEPHT